MRHDGADWPIPGTRWRTLRLGPAARSTADAAGGHAIESYPQVPSLPGDSDPYNSAIAGLHDTNISQRLGRSYTTAPLRHDMLSAGPAALDVRLSSTAPQTNIWAVVSDVWPDGTPHPMAPAGSTATSRGSIRSARCATRRPARSSSPTGA